jgi:transketolase
MNGGLGDSIAQVLALNSPAPLEMVGVKDTFGESGIPEELMAKYGLSTERIVTAALAAMKRK